LQSSCVCQQCQSLVKSRTARSGRFVRQARALCRMSKARHPLRIDRHVRDLFGSRVARQDPPDLKPRRVCVSVVGWCKRHARWHDWSPLRFTLTATPSQHASCRHPAPLRVSGEATDGPNECCDCCSPLSRSPFVTEFSFFRHFFSFFSFFPQKAPIFLICTPDSGQGKCMGRICSVLREIAKCDKILHNSQSCEKSCQVCAVYAPDSCSCITASRCPTTLWPEWAVGVAIAAGDACPAYM
jgi:hypothetical protein